ncbi:leucyl aminopeptidase [Lampropedia puyangensis]|uniref:Probable cytosol aminopeptidase n=1 Tax=Lampropedia puyangensis TaxID=1330072 RepID=A0A4S8FCX9_9BURK|nr:leucyl aminopeptidase [Lampropedia puyangensis]THU04454.1 leucyl aminopeptidase [Lampropedia puyangensis]
MPTTLELKSLNLLSAAKEKVDLLVVLLPDADSVKTATGKTTSGLETAITQALAAKDLDLTQTGNHLWLYSVAQVAARRVLLIASGAGSATDISKALASATSALRQSTTEKAAVVSLHATLDDCAVHALVQSLSDSGYRYTATKPSEKKIALQKLVVGVADKAKIQRSFVQSVGIAAGVELAKELGNLPANHATPTELAKTAQELGKAKGITAKIHGPRDIAKLKMGAFLAVAQGSTQPPQFIELHYQGAAKSEQPIVLVGKGVTFDTGGISIKPAAGMDEMKFDMCGAASVLGVFQALAKLQPRVNVVGLIAATENMPGGKAIKPGDVVTSMSGKTIEILNTDAEGRLILCDALTYADRLQPKAVIDIATLTGACVIALGGVRSGVFASDDALAHDLLKAGEQTQDLGWRMPLDAEYGGGLKTNFADMANVAGREAGAVTAAKFLQKFIGSWPWAHLDIAGTAWKSGAAKGATGRPVGLLTQYILNQALPLPAATKTSRKTTGTSTSKKG